MSKNRKYGLREKDLEKIISVLRSNPGISEVILFGSRAKGDFSSGSDIDIALKGAGLKLDDILNARIEIDKLSLPYKFDIIIYDRIKEKALQEHIDRVGIRLYK